MDILLMIILVIMVVSIVTWNNRNLQERIASAQEENKKSCTLHKWVYRKQPDTEYEYMVCEVCGMIPGCEDLEGD